MLFFCKRSVGVVAVMVVCFVCPDLRCYGSTVLWSIFFVACGYDVDRAHIFGRLSVTISDGYFESIYYHCLNRRVTCAKCLDLALTLLCIIFWIVKKENTSGGTMH